MKNLILISALLLGLAPELVHAGDQHAIRLGTILPTGTAQYAILQELGETWRKESGGSVKLTLFGDGRLGGEAEMVKKIRIKQINAGLFSVVGLSELDAGATGLQLVPLAFRTWDEVDYVREKMRARVEARLRERGFHVLCWADAGWVRFFSKRPAVVPEDFRTAKIFAWSGSDKQTAIMKAIGFRPVPLETTDLLLGFNTDLINAAPLPPLVALAGQLHRQAPFMLDLHWCPIVGAAVVRTDVWERIPAELRSRLEQQALAAGERIRQRGRLEDEEAVRAMQKHGLHVETVNAAAMAEWERLRAELYPRIRGVTVPEEIFDAVQQHLAEYRASGGGA